MDRKKIIERIMGEELNKRGYSIYWDRKHGSFWPIAIFQKGKVDFEIREDLSDKGKLSLRDVYKKEYVLRYSDEESFAAAIGQFEKMLEKDGYEILEKKINLPRLDEDDRIYVGKNYIELSKKYCIEHGIDPYVISIVDGVNLIIRDMEFLFDKDWESIKEAFYELSSFYLTVLLKIPGTELEAGESIMVNRDCNNSYLQFMESLFLFWRTEKENVLLRGIKRLLSDEEQIKYGIQ